MNDINEEIKDWVEFLKNFTSAEIYTLRIKNFIEYTPHACSFKNVNSK